MSNVTHFLLVIRKDVMECPSQNVQCHSLPVGHRKGCDKAAFNKICNVTHFLMIIGTDAMSLLRPFTTYYAVCHSLAVGCRKECDEIALHKMCKVTHKLLVVG